MIGLQIMLMMCLVTIIVFLYYDLHFKLASLFFLHGLQCAKLSRMNKGHLTRFDNISIKEIEMSKHKF